ncbi:hypothetical protein QZH41_018258 [Actinostola sp. cb2023]|nr:hypothetical protein QZH41_018258 [Actinostola sp. cb2023]
MPASEQIGRPFYSLSMHPHIEFVIMEEVMQHPEKTLVEIAHDIYQQTGAQYSLSGIFYYLKRNNISRKMLSKIAIQRSEEACITFRSDTCLLEPEMLVFLDESGFDKRICRTHGYAPIGAHNAAIHHIQTAINSILATGAMLIFLPPYSPDFMPCEELFAQAKRWIRENDVVWRSCPDHGRGVFSTSHM